MAGRSRDCRPYMSQFRKYTSTDHFCSCKTSAEQDFKRHREIAELVLRLESFVAGNGHFSKGRDTSGYTNTTWFKSSAFGINGNANLIRDNKASIIVESVGSTAAKMLSLSNTQVTVKASDVERIKSLLYPYSSLPSTYDAMDDKLRIKGVTDGPIHRLRQRQDIMGDKQEPDYETITAKVLNDLHVPSLTEDGSRETKAIAKKLKMAIVEVLKVDFRQADETRKRQIGFAYFLTSGALARIQDCVAVRSP
jgi:hypothetical protein